jgi:hypothetical protein
MPAHPSTLVGRRIELTRLSRLLTEDAARTVVVTGEPGLGKTALIEQMCVRAAAAGWQVVRVLGVAAEEPFALGGLHQLMLRLEDVAAGLTKADRAVLAPVFGGEPDSAVAVLPLVSAVLRLLESAAQKQPVLLVADDVHWLDSVSAQVISRAIGCGSAICFRSLPKAASRAAASGPFEGAQSRFGGISAAMTSAAVRSRGRVTARSARRATSAAVSV